MDGKKTRSIYYKIFILLALLASTILLVSLLQKIDPDLVLFGDSFQYWAAGRLFMSGDNPYEYENVLALRYSAGYTKAIDLDVISMMLYPPWIFPLLVPFSILSYSLSRMLWLFFHIIIVFLASRTMWYLYKGPKKYEFVTYLVSFSFIPTLYVLGIGHITTLHLIGIVAFLFMVTKRTRLTDLAAGFFVSFILLKPQLLFIFIIALTLWIIYSRRWWILWGMFIFIVGNVSFALFINHDIITQYLESIIKYPMGTWATPTPGMLLRLIFGIDKDWLQILPSLIGIIWIFFYWGKNRDAWDWYRETPLLLLVSFAFSPYMWTYDMVILVIPLIYICILFITTGITLLSIISTTIYIVLNISSLIVHRTRPDFWVFWLAPSLLIWFYFTKKSIIKKSIIAITQKINTGGDLS
jgi:hypothetical protein